MNTIQIIGNLNKNNFQFDRIKKKIENKLNNEPVVILKLGKSKKIKSLENFIKKLSFQIGDLIPQNSQNKKFIFVYDRASKKNKLPRYHQTRDGGYIHTDNVNIKTNWDYMVLGCLSKGMVGGETILVYAKDVYKQLLNFPDALKELQKKFFWYKKGFSKEIFKKPIIEIFNDKVHFRYLRSYLEEAYDLKKTKMTKKQLFALDTLDSILNQSNVQKRLTLDKGDVLIGKDSEFLHGRTELTDYPNAIPFFKKNSNKPIKRTLIRVWIKKK